MISLGLKTKMSRCTRVRQLLSRGNVSTSTTARSGPTLLRKDNFLLEAFDTGKADHEADITSEPRSLTHRFSTSSISEKVMLPFSTFDSCPAHAGNAGAHTDSGGWKGSGGGLPLSRGLPAVHFRQCYRLWESAQWSAICHALDADVGGLLPGARALWRSQLCPHEGALSSVCCI